jgi:hypothetical protein
MEIEKSQHHDIVVGVGGGGLTSFFVPGEVDKAFKVNEWTLEEMVEILTSIARECSTKIITLKNGTIIEEPAVTPRERMAAIAMLEKKAKDSMVLGGLIQKDQLQVRKTLSDGSEAEYNAEGMRLAREGSSRLQETLNLLEKASTSNDSDIIDVEVIADDHDTGTGGDVFLEQPGAFLSNKPRSSGAGRGRSNNPGPSGGNGDGTGVGIHEEQRPTSCDPFDASKNDDQETVQGAGNERGSGIAIESGRGRQGAAVGDESGTDRDGDQCDPESPDEPWWDAPYSDEEPSSPTESAADIAARVATTAQNRYLEKRKGRNSSRNT